MPNLPTLLKEATALVVAGCLLGLVINHRLVWDAFSGELEAAAAGVDSVVDLTVFPAPVLLDELQILMDEEAVVVVDARPAELYARGHIPGAHSLPLLNPEEALATFRHTVPVDRSIVTYCSGYGCQDSFDLAMRLILAGYQDVRIYEGGFPEWQAAKLPVEGNEP